jgi:hypothetical protein
MFHFLRARAGTLGCALALSGGAIPAPSQAATAASAPLAIPPYASVFAGYRRFDDQSVQPWRASNDTVERVGGWSAYAREGAGLTPALAPRPLDTQPTPAPSTPAASAPGPMNHAGYQHPGSQP